jgi:hypothetical protein
MNIKSKLLLAGSALLFSATMAFGAITSDQLASQFQADGYSYIRIKTGLTQIKVEAVKDGTLYEVVYDIATGAAIDTSTHAIGPIDTPDPGVIVKAVQRDFEDHRRGNDNGADIGDDHGPDHGLLGDHGSNDDGDHVGGVDDDSDQGSGAEDDGDKGGDSGRGSRADGEHRGGNDRDND